MENIQNQVLPEPDTSVTEPVCTVRFRGPQNFTAQRRFLMSSPLKVSVCGTNIYHVIIIQKKKETTFVKYSYHYIKYIYIYFFYY